MSGMVCSLWAFLSKMNKLMMSSRTIDIQIHNYKSNRIWLTSTIGAFIIKLASFKCLEYIYRNILWSRSVSTKKLYHRLSFFGKKKKTKWVTQIKRMTYSFIQHSKYLAYYSAAQNEPLTPVWVTFFFEITYEILMYGLKQITVHDLIILLTLRDMW